jgi:hypothetical protein
MAKLDADEQDALDEATRIVNDTQGKVSGQLSEAKTQELRESLSRLGDLLNVIQI